MVPLSFRFPLDVNLATILGWLDFALSFSLAVPGAKLSLVRDQVPRLTKTHGLKPYGSE